MHYYLEQWHNGRWMHLNDFTTNEAAGDFYWLLFRAGMRDMRIVAVHVWGE